MRSAVNFCKTPKKQYLKLLKFCDLKSQIVNITHNCKIKKSYLKKVSYTSPEAFITWLKYKLEIDKLTSAKKKSKIILLDIFLAPESIFQRNASPEVHT